MKKIILLACITCLIAGCQSRKIPETKVLPYGFVVIEMDSCEYIGTASANSRDLFSHKGNCHFCKERRQKELKELVEQLKKKIIMATIRAYTTIEQSRKLAEILPIESADMFYRDNGVDVKLVWEHNAQKVKYPCWSLAALLDVLPSSTLDSSDNHRYRFRCMERYTEWYDNAIDACVAMIERLHELKML